MTTTAAASDSLIGASAHKADLRGFRLTSLDAYRGFVMFLMMAEVLHLPQVAAAFPNSAFWQLLKFHNSHVEWVGGSLHDLIQPSFSFMVGVSLPFAIASRLAKGQPFAFMFGHAVWRALLLIWLGVFLRSIGKPQTNWTFDDTLTQIGMGYTFLFLLAFRSVRVQCIALALILLGYWAAFALYPLPGAGFDYDQMGVPAEWRQAHMLSGFAAHWNKNSNLAWAADQWFLNLFPRAKPFVFSGGGYATLSFIPTLGTMILGLIAGGWLRGERMPREKLRWLVSAGVLGLALGGLLHGTGICPVVKRIWTPAWTFYSGGWCFLLLAAFYAIIDVRGYKRWAFPFVVIGMNSIAIYCLTWMTEGFIISSLKTHFGPSVFNVLGPSLEPVLLGAAIIWIF